MVTLKPRSKKSKAQTKKTLLRTTPPFAIRNGPVLDILVPTGKTERRFSPPRNRTIRSKPGKHNSRFVSPEGPIHWTWVKNPKSGRDVFVPFWADRREIIHDYKIPDTEANAARRKKKTTNRTKTLLSRRQLNAIFDDPLVQKTIDTGNRYIGTEQIAHYIHFLERLSNGKINETVYRQQCMRNGILLMAG